MSLPKLTTEERVLLALLPLAQKQDLLEVPPGSTQIGLAMSIGARRSYVSVVLDGLKRRGLVEESLRHVQGSSRRRAAYVLTHTGRTRAQVLRKAVGESKIALLDGQNRREFTLDEALALLRGSVTLLDFLIAVRDGCVDLARIHGEGQSASPPRFQSPLFGRESELALLESHLRSPRGRVGLLTGLPGVGKTALLAEFARRHPLNLCWATIKEWDVFPSFLRSLGRFFAERGRGDLLAYCNAASEATLPEASRILQDILEERSFLFVFDDAHRAPAAIGELIVVICEAALQGRSKIILGGREPPMALPRTLLLGSAERWRLESLQKQEAYKFLSWKGVPSDRREEIFRRTGGLPLFLTLAEPEGLPSLASMEEYLRAEVFSHLTEEAYRALELLTLSRRPFRSSQWTVLGVAEEAIGDLVAKSLLLETSGVEVHELIRETVNERMGADTRVAGHRRLARLYDNARALSERAEWIHHLVHGEEDAVAATALLLFGDKLIRGGFAGEVGTYARLLESRLPKDEARRIRHIQAQALITLGDIVEAESILSAWGSVEGGKTRDADALYLLGVVNYRKGQREEAENFLKLAFRTAQERGDLLTIGKSANVLGILSWRKGDLRGAEEYYRRSLGIYQEVGDISGVSGVLT